MSNPKSDTSNFRLSPGDRVGRYRLLAPLASGGMAEVWAAKPEGRLGLSRTVAMKVVGAEHAADEEYTRLLIDEATVASAIHHPNVCDLLELDQYEDLIFMVMEWVAGDSLAGLLHQSSQLDPLKYHLAVRIVADACAGAHAAHEACDQEGEPLGIVHRDISPPNILLSLQGQVKVSDFGIAKARHQLHARTRTGEIKGKFAYIPSEQIVGDTVDRRADVYALGCVLYVSTLGLRPFGSGPQAMDKILRGQYKRPREIRPQYPEDLERIIVRALQTDRGNRYQTADELRLSLEEWLVDRDQVVTSDDLATLVRRRLSEEKRHAIEELRKLSRIATREDLMRGLEVVEREQTPTAGSGLVSVPAELIQRPPPHADPAGLTQRGPHADPTLLQEAPPSSDPLGSDLAAKLDSTGVLPPTSPLPSPGRAISAPPTRPEPVRNASWSDSTPAPHSRMLVNDPPASVNNPIIVEAARPRSLIPSRTSGVIIVLLACIIVLLLAVVALLLFR